MTIALGLTIELDLPVTTAESRVREALAAEGFGVLTEIDLRSTFKAKLGHDFPPYRILGACNPGLAFRALNAEPRVGLLLPCNVTIEGRADGKTRVGLVEPLALLGADALSGHPVVAEVAREASGKLERVVRRLAEASATPSPTTRPVPS